MDDKVCVGSIQPELRSIAGAGERHSDSIVCFPIEFVHCDAIKNKIKNH